MIYSFPLPANQPAVGPQSLFSICRLGKQELNIPSLRSGPFCIDFPPDCGQKW